MQNSIDTATCEARVKKGESLNMGCFRLGKPLIILDFTTDRFSESQKSNSYKWIIDEQFSKPVDSNKDSKSEYLPTQFIAYLIKERGYDGIKYSSAVYENGYNICVFEALNMAGIGWKVIRFNSTV